MVTFNRYPTLTTAYQRRILGLLTGAYFDDVLLLDIISSAQSAGATKTRGRSGWIACNAFGRIGRIGAGVLRDLQYQHRGPLTEFHKQAFAFHCSIIRHVPSREVQVLHSDELPVVVYTDAEFSPESGRPPRLGWVVFPGPNMPVTAQTLQLSPSLFRTWKQRRHQIFPAESTALPILTWACHHHLANRDVIWYIDNEASAAAAIRGSTSEPDVNVMIQTAHLMWMHLNARVWIEWIDSKSNPSDGLSRDGTQDEWTRRQGWWLSESRDPPGCEILDEPEDLFNALIHDIGTGPSRCVS